MLAPELSWNSHIKNFPFPRKRRLRIFLIHINKPFKPLYNNWNKIRSRNQVLSSSIPFNTSHSTTKTTKMAKINQNKNCARYRMAMSRRRINKTTRMNSIIQSRSSGISFPRSLKDFFSSFTICFLISSNHRSISSQVQSSGSSPLLQFKQ